MAINARRNRRIEAVEIETHTASSTRAARDRHRLVDRAFGPDARDLFGCENPAAPALDDFSFTVVDIARADVDRPARVAQSALHHIAEHRYMEPMHRGEHHAVQVS